MTDQMMFNVFQILMVCLFVFVLIREVVCWYWKINKGILLQEKSIKNQEQIIELLLTNNDYLLKEQEARNYKY